MSHLFTFCYLVQRVLERKTQHIVGKNVLTRHLHNGNNMHEAY